MNHYRKEYSNLACFGRYLFAAGFLISIGSTATGQSVDSSEVIEEVVVVGTRAAPRSVQDSSVPVDVISSEAFENQAGSDMIKLIRSVVPSFHVSDNPSRDLAALLRPVNLRGLAPDHTLVLMNNKRRHRGSVIQWISNGASNGAQGPDISAIPSIAIKRMEVLRDGASAQYGSDAIAGVLNFVLKDASEGFSVSAKSGFYTADTSEDMTSIAGNVGLPLSDNGFANFSLEYAESAPTDRSVQHGHATQLIAAGIPNVAVPAKPWGSPRINNSISIVANIGVDIADGHQFYAFGNTSNREVETFFFFRSPMNRNGVYKTGANKFLVGGPGCQAKYDVDSTGANVSSFHDLLVADTGCFSYVELYPEGFTPRFGAEISDTYAVTGIRGDLANGLFYDISASIGENSMAGYLKNSLNASLGPESQRDFDIGDYTQTETNFNIDLSYPVDVGWASDLNIAGGLEARNEEFEITAGERASYETGSYGQYGFAARSNGFGGFNPASSGAWDRANIAGYLDLEADAKENWRIGGAVRWEDFDGFGSTTNFKLTTRIQVSDVFAVRGSIGTGFRAPTPGQSNARNLSTVVRATDNVFTERGTIGSTHPVAMALGGRELQPEESDNLTFGAIIMLDNGLSLTVDYFSIDINERIALSGNFTVTPEIQQDLISQGVPGAAEFNSVRYFTNDFDTETSGVDVVLSHGWDTSAGATDLLISYNHTETDVVNSTLVGGSTITNLERGSPQTRYNVTITHARNNWYFMSRFGHYGEWYDDHTGNFEAGYSLLDVLAQYHFNSGFSVSLGAENVTDEYPDEAVNFGNGRKYPRYAPGGSNGSLIYARINYSL